MIEALTPLDRTSCTKMDNNNVRSRLFRRIAKRSIGHVVLKRYQILHPKILPNNTQVYAISKRQPLYEPDKMLEQQHKDTSNIILIAMEPPTKQARFNKHLTKPLDRVAARPRIHSPADESDKRIVIRIHGSFNRKTCNMPTIGYIQQKNLQYANYKLHSTEKLAICRLCAT